MTDKVIRPQDTAAASDMGAAVDFFQDAKTTNRKIADVNEGTTLGDELDYKDLGEEVFGKSRKLSDEEVGGGKKKRKKTEEEEYEDINQGSESEEDEEGEEGSGEEGEEDEDSSSDEGDDSESDGDDEDTDSGDDDSDEDGSEEESLRPTKGFSLVTIDGEEVKVPDSTKIALMIDGQKEVLTFGNLKKIKSGEVSLHRKFTELGEERKRVAAREGILEKELKAERDFGGKARLLLSQLKPALEQGHFEDILNEVCLFFGGDAAALWDNYNTKNLNYYEKYSKLTQEQKDALRLNTHTQLKEIALKRKEKLAEAERENQQFENFKTQLLKETPGNFTQGDIREAWAELQEAHKRGELPEDLVRQIESAGREGKWRYALSYAQERRLDKRIVTSVNKIAPKYKDKIHKIGKVLRDELKMEKLMAASEKDFDEMIRRLTGAKPSEKKKKDKGLTTTNSLRDKASPRHKAGRPQERQKSASGESFVTPGRDFWGVSFPSSLRTTR